MLAETITHVDGAGEAQGLQNSYTYSPLGDVTSVLERNEVETTHDDVYTVITYPACGPRTGDRALGPDDTWVSVPQSVTIYGGSDDSGPLLRLRDGGPDLCAITEMGFDTRGSYDTVASPDSSTPACADYPARTLADDDYEYLDHCDGVAPESGDPTRYSVDYSFDPFRFTDIAAVTDNHGDLTYRTDGKGRSIHQMQHLGARSYTYDANGNLTDWREPCSKSAEVSRQLTWDAENRVTRIAEGNNDTDYRYSAEGVRSLERGPGGLTWFVNDQWRTVNDGLRYSTIYLGGQPFATHRTSPEAAAVQPTACADTAETSCVCPPGGACLVADASDCTSGQLYDPTTSTCQPRGLMPALAAEMRRTRQRHHGAWRRRGHRRVFDQALQRVTPPWAPTRSQTGSSSRPVRYSSDRKAIGRGACPRVRRRGSPAR